MTFTGVVVVLSAITELVGGVSVEVVPLTAPGSTVIEPVVPLTVPVIVSVAVTVCEPAVLSVTATVLTPASPLTKP